MKHHIYWKTARHAAASFTALVLVLITLYAQNQSSTFTASFIGFKRALHYDIAKDASTFEEVWEWFDKFSDSIASDTLSQINANCGYNKPNYQDVNIDGITYKLFNPDFQFGPCDNFMYVSDPHEKVYLSDTGNHELKAVGVFTGRSSTLLSRDKEKIVQNNELAVLDAITDDRIIEICDVTPWGEPCVLKDGFAESMVSSLDWDGEVIDGYYAFNHDKPTHILRPSEDKTPPEFIDFKPCFVNNNSALALPVMGHSVNEEDAMIGFEDCHKTWITSGHEVRKQCLDASVSQADAKYSFMISVMNYSSLVEMRNLLYGCEEFVSLGHLGIGRAFLADSELVSNSLENNKMHGFFIKTDSQAAWIEDSSLLDEKMAFLKIIDRSTRVFSVIALTRNDGIEDLYYSKISFSFKMLVDGKIILRMEASYIPIVHYMYGLDGYPWVFREVYVCEVIFCIVFFLFIVREIHQDYMTIIQFFSVLKTRGTAKISDILAAGESNSDHDKKQPDKVAPDVEEEQCENLERVEEIANDGLTNNAEVHDKNDDEEIPNALDSKPSMLTAATVSSVGNMTLIPDDKNWYNIVDWLTILIGVLAVYYRASYVLLCYDAVNYLDELDEDPDDPEAELNRHEGSFGVTLDQFTDIEYVANIYFIISLVFVFLCVFQFFRYLEFDARFGIVARTLRQSFWVLMPVLLVFITILSTYAVIGTILYGTSLPEWSTFYNSLGSLFLLILGEFEGYPRMRHVSSSLTGVYFWSFVAFVILVLFNMVLAIILTVYDETYKQITLEVQERLFGGTDKKDE